MVAQAHPQNGAAGEQDSCTVATNHVKHQALTTLSTKESKLLDSCEQVIAKHLTTFFEVGKALAKIRDGKLYRTEFRTFEDYCRKRWGMGRFNAYRQMQAAGVMKNLLTMVNTPLPENERQVRALVGLRPDVAGRAWKAAVEEAAGQKVTGKLVHKAAKELDTSRTHNRESWQDLVEPLLNEALKKTKDGDRASVQDLIYRALLRVEMGLGRIGPTTTVSA